jgi:hypothetical protein
MITLKRYKQNLKVIDNKVYSYDTLVAKIKGNKIKKVKWKAVSKKKLPAVLKDVPNNAKCLEEEITTSPTTSKHINYVARELNLELI